MIRRAVMGVTVERRPDRLVVVVRIGVVETLVQGDRQDRNSSSGPEQGANRGRSKETTSHGDAVSHAIENTAMSKGAKRCQVRRSVVIRSQLRNCGPGTHGPIDLDLIVTT